MNEVHPTAIIGPDVNLGSGNVIGAYSVILGDVHLGSDNWIGPHVVIGSPAEHRSFRDEDGGMGRIEIGSANYIYEFTAIQGPTRDQTRLGSRCFIMDKVHIAHDCEISDGVTLAPSVVLGGHVKVERQANLGMGAIVHQFLTIPELSMIGMGSVVTRELPPFSVAFGSPAKVHGLNVVGIQRSSYGQTGLESIRYLMGEEVSNEFESEPINQSAADALARWMQRSNQSDVV